MVDVWQLLIYSILQLIRTLVDSIPTSFQSEVSIPPWMPPSVQAGSSILLVLITAVYAYQTRQSTKLARQQMESEKRQRHTDTLQAKTGVWRDDFPVVCPTQIDVPNGTPNPAGDFTLYPASLENDPYFHDLLENHARDVSGLTTTITEKIQSYEQRRDEFVENTALTLDGRLWSLVEPQFYEWLFERIVLLERGVMTESALQEDLRDAFASPRVEGSSTIYAGETNRRRKKDVLLFHRTRSTAQNQDEDVWHRLSANRIIDVIDCLDGLAEYSTAVEASELLTEIENDVRELERQVIWYDEMVQIPDDCEYVSST